MTRAKTHKWWTYDTGASLVVRPEEIQDSKMRRKKLEILGVGNHIENGILLENQEIQLEGDPLLPTGRSVRLGEWTFGWSPIFGPSIRKLTPTQQSAINNIQSEQQNLYPIVIDDIPYLNNNDAQIIRDSIIKGMPRSFVASSGPGGPSGGSLAPSVWILGTNSDSFDRVFLSDETFRQICLDAFHKYGLDRKSFGELWHKAETPFEFLVNLSDISTGDAIPITIEETNRSKGEEELPDGLVQEEPETNEIKGVSFGDADIVIFDTLETVETIAECNHEVRACKAKSIVFDQHLLCHEPHDPNCVICAAGKRRKSKFVRGGASGKDYPFPFLVADWCNPRNKASDGSRYVLVFKWVQTGALWGVSCKTKKECVVSALESARTAFGILDQRFVFHTDGERVLLSPEVKKYLVGWSPEDPGGLAWRGVPHRSNTNSHVENAVKLVEDGARTILLSSGFPSDMWHYAIDHYCTAHNANLGILPAINTTTLLPLGCIGRSPLPKGLVFNDKFSSRAKLVCYTGPDLLTSGGARILFAGADGKIRKSTILFRDVDWEPEVFAFKRTEKNLRDVFKTLPEFCAENPITAHQAQCEICQKWRFTLFDPERLGDREFTCVPIGVSCSEKEDPRVYDEFDESELIDLSEANNDESLEFLVEEEFKVCDDESEEERATAVAFAKRAKLDIDNCVKKWSEKWNSEDKEIGFTSGAAGSNQAPKRFIDTKDFESAFNRLGTKTVTEDDVAKLHRVIERELRADKCDRAVARVVVVKNKEAFARDNPDRPNWVKSLDSEVHSLLHEFETLEACDISQVRAGDQILPSLLIMTRKADGRFKSRIVACGSFERIDSGSSYSAVVSHDIWMQSIVTNAALGGACYQLDVKNAFLQTQNSDISEEQAQVYVRPPKECDLGSRVLWKVVGSLYGLKSAPKAWKKTLTNHLTSSGFSICPLDDSILLNDKGIKILLYVDDLVVLGPRDQCISVLQDISRRFTCTDWIDLSLATRECPLLFLGHELFLENNVEGGQDLIVSQALYSRTLLSRLGYLDCKALRSLPADEFSFAYLNAAEKVGPEEHKWFRSVVGGLNYLCLGTRPEILACTSILAEGQSAPTTNHISSAKKLLRFLAGYPEFELRLPINKISHGQTIKIVVHYDSNFAAERARSGGTLWINGALTHWWSKRQRSIVLSTAEAELVGCSTGVKELIGCRNLMLTIFGDHAHPSQGNLKFDLRIFGDNQAACLISQGNAGVRKVRHLTLADLFTRDVIESEGVIAKWIETNLNSSDPLTKVLGIQKMHIAWDNLNMRSCPSPTGIALSARIVSGPIVLWDC